jgi:AraC-like DNA-binding protein/DNA-binding NarL/FixJ family response regulator
MYKVCFADDEVRNHKVWENLIDWPGKGFVIVGTATDGQEALNLFNKERPELMLIDIKMPVMDGLECIRRIREVSSSVKLVLVTAFGEFEFARQAIEYRVGGYLLKPVKRTALAELASRIRAELDLEQEQTTEFSALREEQYADELALALQSLVSGQPSPKGLDVLWRRPVLLGDFFFYSDSHLCLVQDEIDGILGVMEEILTQLQATPLAKIAVSPGHILTALPIRRSLAEELPQVIELLQNRGIVCNAYFHNEPIRPGNIEKIRDCLGKTQDRNFYKIHGSLEPLLEDQKQGEGELFTSRDSAISLALEQLSPEPLKDCMEKELKIAIRLGIPPWLTKEACFELLEQLKMSIHAIAPVGNVDMLDGINLQAILQIPKLDPLSAYMNRTVEDIFSRLQNNAAKNKGANRTMVLKINAYARSHFQERSFSVEQTAVHVGLSRNYLTKIYKKTTYIGFWEYVTGLRMGKAKQLLRRTDDTLLSIAESVGYGSEYHFCRKFKKYNGVSPGAWRKSIQESAGT